MIAQIPHHLGQLLSQTHVSTDRHHLEPTSRVSLPTSHAPEETAVPVAARLTCGGCPREQTFRPPVQESPSHRQHTGEVPTANRQLPEELGTQRPHTTLRPRSHSGLAPPSQTPYGRAVETALPHTCEHTCHTPGGQAPAAPPVLRSPGGPAPSEGNHDGPSPPAHRTLQAPEARPPGRTSRRAAARDPAADADTPENPPQNRRVETPGRRPQTRRRPGPRCRRRHAQEPASEPPGRGVGREPRPAARDQFADADTPKTRLRTTGSRCRGADPRPAAAARDQVADADTPKNPPQNHWVETPGRRPQTRRPGSIYRGRHAQEPASEPPGRDARGRPQTYSRPGPRCRRQLPEPVSAPHGPHPHTARNTRAPAHRRDGGRRASTRPVAT
ncbi:translation initiation factor IF-2-like [Panthera uncia]|uniref:translation initiation factor IF-2-like n=1 Tax=Panthera uncia TaxID=29064 RepID=UPI0020FF82AD|nr:translation initiation factor IF-2-like [Panthera uncia]